MELDDDDDNNCINKPVIQQGVKVAWAVYDHLFELFEKLNGNHCNCSY